MEDETSKTLIFSIFGIFLVVLMLCTIVELFLAGGFNGLLNKPSLPWLIAGWCIFLASFYGVRKFYRITDEQDDEYF